MREKRRFIRFYIALKVNYILQKDPKTEKIGTTKDVSAGGLQLLTSEQLEAGGKVDLKIFLPDALNPVHLKGVVMWSKELGQAKGPAHSHSAGIEFGKIEEDNKNTFLKFLCGQMYEKTGDKKPGDNA
ncbi:MAG: PilZ domain-containing protein [Candidatus Omnitrophota bacterium]